MAADCQFHAYHLLFVGLFIPLLRKRGGIGVSYFGLQLCITIYSFCPKLTYPHDYINYKPTLMVLITSFVYQLYINFKK